MSVDNQRKSSCQLTFKANNLNLSKLVSIATDGDSSAVGKNKGVVSLLQIHMENQGVTTTL